MDLVSSGYGLLEVDSLITSGGLNSSAVMGIDNTSGEIVNW